MIEMPGATVVTLRQDRIFERAASTRWQGVGQLALVCKLTSQLDRLTLARTVARLKGPRGIIYGEGCSLYRTATPESASRITRFASIAVTSDWS